MWKTTPSVRGAGRARTRRPACRRCCTVAATAPQPQPRHRAPGARSAESCAACCAVAVRVPPAVLSTLRCTTSAVICPAASTDTPSQDHRLWMLRRSSGSVLALQSLSSRRLAAAAAAVPESPKASPPRAQSAHGHQEVCLSVCKRTSYDVLTSRPRCDGMQHRPRAHGRAPTAGHASCRT
jgi:hypothetical protein